MKAYRAVLALLSIVCIGHLSQGFKMNPKVELPPLKDQRVLVIGASGDVGNLVSVYAVNFSGDLSTLLLCCACTLPLVLQPCVCIPPSFHVLVTSAPAAERFAMKA